MTSFFRFSPAHSVFVPGLNHIRAVQWLGDPTDLDQLKPFLPDYKFDFETDLQTGLDMVVINEPSCQSLVYQGDYIVNLAGHLTVISELIFSNNFKKVGNYNA